MRTQPTAVFGPVPLRVAPAGGDAPRCWLEITRSVGPVWFGWIVASNPLKKQTDKINAWVKKNRIIVGVVGALVVYFLVKGCGSETVSKTIPDGYASAGRQLYVNAPDQSKPRPLVLVLHDDSSSASEIERSSEASKVAGRKNFVVAYPEAVGGTWRAADPRGADAQYLRDVVQYVSQEYKIDSKRVYVWGLGEGAKLAEEVACAGTDRVFAAVGFVGRFDGELGRDCPPEVGKKLISQDSWDRKVTNDLWDESKNHPPDESKKKK
jgi:polyhydroxybutyrate depolymerase